MNNSSKFSFDDLLTGGMFDPQSPIGDPVGTIVDYWVAFMPLREQRDKFLDLEDYDRPLDAQLRMIERNMKNHIRAQSNEWIQKELKDLQGSLGS